MWGFWGHSDWQELRLKHNAIQDFYTPELKKPQKLRL
jgi:hypothetical protein